MALMELALGPLLFNWPAGQTADFYARIAGEAPVGRVYIGEVVCGKREPGRAAVLAEAAERLERAGKQVVWSGLAMPATRRERAATLALSAADAGLLEINDVTGLAGLDGARFVAGPLLNVYNEAAARELMRLGCVRVCANVELSLESVGRIAAACPGLEMELFAFGRLPLAMAARCHHARWRGLTKDSCRFICEHDPEGMTVSTLEDEPFLAVNGVQTLSHGVQALDVPVSALRAHGVTALRLSPHLGDMVDILRLHEAYADERINDHELQAELAAMTLCGPLVSGYLHARAGRRRAGAVGNG